MNKNLLMLFWVCLLAACVNHSDPKSSETDPNQAVTPASQESDRKPIKRVCSAPPAPQNIWKLEPLLTEKGLIKDGMTREQKETVIRDYINKKNSVYIKCAKGNS